MRNFSLLLWSSLVLATPIFGCAASSMAPSTDPGDLAFYYRQQAAELSRMAERLQWEADWYSKKYGLDSEQAKRTRAIAKDVQASAEEADAYARAYRSQLPHARVY